MMSGASCSGLGRTEHLVCVLRQTFVHNTKQKIVTDQADLARVTCQLWWVWGNALVLNCMLFDLHGTCR